MLPSTQVRSATVSRFPWFSCVMWICLSPSCFSASQALWAIVFGIIIWIAVPCSTVSLGPERCHLGLHAWGFLVNQWPETPKLVWGVPKGCGLRWGATVWWRQTGILKWQMAYGMPWGVYLFMSLSVLRENDGDFVDVWRTPSQAGGGAWPVSLIKMWFTV